MAQIVNMCFVCVCHSSFKYFFLLSECYFIFIWFGLFLRFFSPLSLSLSLWNFIFFFTLFVVGVGGGGTACMLLFIVFLY